MCKCAAVQPPTIISVQGSSGSDDVSISQGNDDMTLIDDVEHSLSDDNLT